MAAPATIHDLPDDMLHEIFGHVYAAEPKKPLYAHQPPEGAHLALRCVCRRWRRIADWEKLSTSFIGVNTWDLADAGAVRPRHPAAFKALSLFGPTSVHTTSVSRAAASLINSSADLRRALLRLSLGLCCRPALALAVTPVASCTALSELELIWSAHKKERVVPANMLAPLSALRTLNVLKFVHFFEDKMPASALLAPLPALPDAPRLTCLVLSMVASFVPVGSDAALGRLRRLELWHRAPVQELVDAEDPFLLRAAFDAGTWRPSRLTGLQELYIDFSPVRDSRALVRPSRTGSRSGSEWAPLAGQVTALDVVIKSGGYSRPSTGIVAGLGVLTALRSLRVGADPSSLAPGLGEPVSIDRVRAPQLTHLVVNCVSTPISVAQFPNLIVFRLRSFTPQQPLNLRSLVARSSLKILRLDKLVWRQSPGSINLAELFVGGDGWPVLEELWLENMVLEWDETGLAGAPTAAEFAGRARQLLPALVKVTIHEPRGPGALPDRSRVGFVLACRRHVVPALLGLRAGGR